MGAVRKAVVRPTLFVRYETSCPRTVGSWLNDISVVEKDGRTLVILLTVILRVLGHHVLPSMLRCCHAEPGPFSISPCYLGSRGARMTFLPGP